MTGTIVDLTRTDVEDEKAAARTQHPQKTPNASTAASVDTTLTSARSPREPTQREEDAAMVSVAAAAAAAAAARSRSPTPPRAKPDGAREASGTQERVNLAVQTSLAGRQTRPCRTATPYATGKVPARRMTADLGRLRFAKRNSPFPKFVVVTT